MNGRLNSTTGMLVPKFAVCFSAVDANVILLQELGLDPGLDHMSAVAMIEDAKLQGQSVCAYLRCCHFLVI